MTHHLDESLGSASLPRTSSGLDAQLLDKAIELAELGRPGARPNPVVGAVLARADGEIIAVGHHERRGMAHAERVCLDEHPAPIPDDATLYVSLEPCSHHGRTPPCVDAIIERGVRRVVFASCDANPDTAGVGPARLVAAGVRVERGPGWAERRALQQNAGFHSVHLRGRAYVHAKWAMTPTGRFATGDPQRRWISGEESRSYVHYLRAGSGAVACGIGTVLADDPLLTVRGPMADHTVVPPTRVVYDRALRIPLNSQLVRSAGGVPVLVVCAHDAPADRETALLELGVAVWRAAEPAPGKPCLLAQSLAMLARHGINDVLLESGPTLLHAFAHAELLDAATVFVADVEASPAQPGIDVDVPFVAQVLDAPWQAMGADRMHHAVLQPAWEFPGATCG